MNEMNYKTNKSKRGKSIELMDINKDRILL
jgi:hypothetical protein